MVTLIFFAGSLKALTGLTCKSVKCWRSYRTNRVVCAHEDDAKIPLFEDLLHIIIYMYL